MSSNESPFDGYEYGQACPILPQLRWRITTPTGKVFEHVCSELYVGNTWGSANAQSQGFSIERVFP